MNKLHREVVVMPTAEHRNLLKLVKLECKPKSRVIRNAIANECKSKLSIPLDKVTNK